MLLNTSLQAVVWGKLQIDDVEDILVFKFALIYIMVHVPIHFFNQRAERSVIWCLW